MSDISKLHKPLRRRVFWILFLTMFIVSLGIMGVGYWFAERAIFNNAKDRLLRTATKTAAFIPVESHEAIQSFEDTKTDSYGVLRLYLQSILSANPDIDDVYTLRPTEDPSKYAIVLSAKDTQDENDDGFLDDAEIAPTFGETYSTAQHPNIIVALSGSIVNDDVTYDDWGAWLRAFAPLRDSNNEVVAIVGVDMHADVVANSRHEIRKGMLYSLFFVLMFLLIPAYFLSIKLSKPIKIFAESIDKVLHGDYTFRLPDKGKGEEHVFAVLFNQLVDAFKGQKEQLKKEKNKDKIGHGH